jgi:TorA maturation chaperone TorD
MSAATALIDDVEQARADIYRLLGAALSHPPNVALLDYMRALPIISDGSDLSAALIGLARAAQVTSLSDARTAYDTLFVGIARGELMPYASFYLTGFLHDRPLARLRADIAGWGLRAAPGHPDPEDHAGTLCEVMAGLIDGAHGAPQPISVQYGFFMRHMVPWLDRFFADLETATNAQLYASIGSLGRVFLNIERMAFQMELSS